MLSAMDAEEELRLATRDATDLAPTTTTTPDAYEREYMSGHGRVLARHRMVSGWKFNTFMGLLAAYTVASAVSTGLLAALAPLAAMGLLWLALSVLRITVSERAVKIQYALFGPTIPIDAITCVRAIRYDALRYGGWGFRRREGGRLYNMIGDGGHAVEIRWLEPDGTHAIVTAGIKDAPAVAADIRAAMEASSKALGGDPKLSALDSAT